LHHEIFTSRRAFGFWKQPNDITLGSADEYDWPDDNAPSHNRTRGSIILPRYILESSPLKTRPVGSAINIIVDLRMSPIKAPRISYQPAKGSKRVHAAAAAGDSVTSPWGKVQVVCGTTTLTTRTTNAEEARNLDAGNVTTKPFSL
jgi:hypothetical protein